MILCVCVCVLGAEINHRKRKRWMPRRFVFVFQSGLIVACYNGYVDVVIALSQCPYLDVNWQDNEGNTALITAAQAGNPPPRPLNQIPPQSILAHMF